MHGMPTQFRDKICAICVQFVHCLHSRLAATLTRLPDTSIGKIFLCSNRECLPNINGRLFFLRDLLAIGVPYTNHTDVTSSITMKDNNSFGKLGAVPSQL